MDTDILDMDTDILNIKLSEHDRRLKNCIPNLRRRL